MVEWVRLRLDVAEFDDQLFAVPLARAADAGFRFTTMSELGDSPEHHRALYELNRTCSSDIPGRGEFYTYPDYLAHRIEVPTYRPDGVIIAIHDDKWIGMTATSLRATEGFAFSEMTGVLGPHRGQGLSLALKIHAIRFVRAAGYRHLVAYHHPDNTAAIGMNRRLGFEDLR